MKHEYDIVIVGSGISGATMAALNKDKRVLVIERGDIGGLAHTEDYNGTTIHKHGAHVFHTDNQDVWDFINKYDIFNGYIHQEKALIDGDIAPFPINLDTFKKYYNMSNIGKIEEGIDVVMMFDNLEGYTINLLGDDLYEKYYKGYLTKYWGMQPKDLPWFLLHKEDFRTTYQANVYTERFQGVPINGYTHLIENMLSNAEVIQADYLSDKEYYDSLAPIVIYTGSLDEYYDYKLGKLPYRAFIHRFSIEPERNYQGCAVVRHCDEGVKVLNTTEHWHMSGVNEENTSSVSRCYSRDYEDGKGYLRGKAYPLDAPQNLWGEYRDMMVFEEGVYIAGHLANYCDMDMAECVEEVMNLNELINDNI